MGTQGAVELGSVLLLFGFEHREHPVGDEVATDDVDGRQNEGCHAQPFRDSACIRADGENCADHGDSADGIGSTHQGRVELRRHFGNQLKAEKCGQNEDKEKEDEFHGIFDKVGATA